MSIPGCLYEFLSPNIPLPYRTLRPHEEVLIEKVSNSKEHSKINFLSIQGCFTVTGCLWGGLPSAPVVLVGNGEGGRQVVSGTLGLLLSDHLRYTAIGVSKRVR